MYIYIKIGKRVFTFGNDRKGEERREKEAPVKDEHREGLERRKEDSASGQGAETSEDNGK